MYLLYNVNFLLDIAVVLYKFFIRVCNLYMCIPPPSVSISIYQAWLISKSDVIENSNVSFLVSKSEVNQGAGAARNAAILQSIGTVLIIQVEAIIQTFYVRKESKCG